MKNKNVRMWKRARKGVSEVIATLLILGITVTLFSTIFVWIQTLPPPEGKRNVEIIGELGIGDESIGNVPSYRYYINLTHKGGEPLSKDMITIVITLTDTLPPAVFIRNVSDSLVNLGDFWEPGEVWRWKTPTTHSVISNVTVQVIDNVKNLIVWQGVLPGKDINAPPQILERGTEPEIVETGKSFKVWVIVKDSDLNYDSVYIDLWKLDNTTFKTPIKMNHTGGWKFMTDNLSLSPSVLPGKYTGIINATDNKSHKSIAQITINVITGEGLPLLVVDRIILSNHSPTRGDNVTITAVIKNMKARAAESSNITFRDYFDGREIWNYTITNFSVAGYGQSLAFAYWEAKPGGVHKIVVNITDVMPGKLNGVGANITVVVTPKILLVDDDGALTGSSNDVVSYMAAALLSANLRYDIAVVSGGADGPGYNTGDKKLRDYDVVIWMGGSTNNTLTTGDQTSLNTFLDNGGRLWLIGQNIFEGVPSWFTNKVGGGISSTVPLPSSLVGTNPGMGWIDTSGFNPSLQSRSPFTIARQLNPVSGSKPLFNDSTNTRILAYQYKAIGGSNNEYRSVVFGFEFATMNDTGDQAVTVYKVINWLGGIDMRSGKDVAVAGQTISPLKPRYNQPVNITAVIRNNGDVNLTNVRTRLYINDQPKTLLDNVTDLPGNGSWKLIKFQWVPDKVGSYIVKVVVDPDNEIDETNEANNVYVSDVGVYTLEVIYTVLVVDDDSSPENGGGGTLPNVAQYVINALTSLGYVNGTDMDIQKVPRGVDRDNTAYN
ncbi:MAG: CARDB domain-containing protein, partial [Thermoplasmata archaeon]